MGAYTVAYLLLREYFPASAYRTGICPGRMSEVHLCMGYMVYAQLQAGSDSPPAIPDRASDITLDVLLSLYIYIVFIQPDV